MVNFKVAIHNAKILKIFGQQCKFVVVILIVPNLVQQNPEIKPNESLQ